MDVLASRAAEPEQRCVANIHSIFNFETLPTTSDINILSRPQISPHFLVWKSSASNFRVSVDLADYTAGNSIPTRFIPRTRTCLYGPVLALNTDSTLESLPVVCHSSYEILWTIRSWQKIFCHHKALNPWQH